MKKSDRNYTLFIYITLIILFGLLAYFNSLNGKFLWDDDFLVKNNVYIKNWSYIPKIFTEDVGAGARSHYGFYRPFQMITYMFDYSLWKLNAVGYHLINIILHILVALSIFWFIEIIFKDRVTSFLTGVFFIVHPVHTEVVSYISGRTDSLAFLFMLVCFILYIKQLRQDILSRYILMLLSYILALLSRETSLILPALLLVYCHVFKEKIKTKEFISILSLTLLYAVLRVTLLRGLLAAGLSDTTVFQRLPGAFAAITNYITLLILPFNLHMEYGYRSFNLAEPRVIIGIGLFFISLIYAFRQRRVNKLISFSTLWFFTGFLPVSNIYPVNAYMAEHWLYLPSLGFFLLSAHLIARLYKKEKLRIITIIFSAALVFFYFHLTIKQNNYWSGPIVFYERALKFTPDSPRMLNNLGDVYCKIGKLEKAVALYKEAIKFDVNCVEAYNNLGAISIKFGKNDDAIAYFKTAIAIDPNIYAEVYNNLAGTYMIIGKHEDAISTLEKAIEIDPNYAMSFNNLAVIYFNKKQYDLAIQYCDKAIELGYKVSPEFLELLGPFRNKK